MVFLILCPEVYSSGISFTYSFTLLGLRSRFLVDLPRDWLLALNDFSAWFFYYFLPEWLFLSWDWLYYFLVILELLSDPVVLALLMALVWVLFLASLF